VPYAVFLVIMNYLYTGNVTYLMSHVKWSIDKLIECEAELLPSVFTTAKKLGLERLCLLCDQQAYKESFEATIPPPSISSDLKKAYRSPLFSDITLYLSEQSFSIPAHRVLKFLDFR
jgi:hypothetical protein